MLNMFLIRSLTIFHKFIDNNGNYNMYSKNMNR
jgi:hypothetical protein